MEERRYWCDICADEANQLQGFIKSGDKMVGSFDLCTDHWMYGLYFKIIPMSLLFKTLREKDYVISILQINQNFETKRIEVIFGAIGKDKADMVKAIFDDLAAKTPQFNGCYLEKKKGKKNQYGLFKEFAGADNEAGTPNN